MRGVDAVEHLFHFLFDSLPECGRSEFHSRFHQFRIPRNRQSRILVFVVDDPTLALGDYFVAKFFGREFVSPLAKRTLGKLLDVALMHQRHALAPGLDRMKNRHAHQALGSGYRDRLDADARIQPYLLLATLQHILVDKFDQLRALGSSLFPFDADVHVLRVLAKDDQVHALRMLHR